SFRPATVSPGGIDMTQNASKQTAITRAVAISCLTVACLAAAGVRAGAPSDALGDEGSLAGTWFVQVTLRDCATGSPLGPAIHSLVTFHGDGTLSEAPA